jgi:hypothetical protein
MMHASNRHQVLAQMMPLKPSSVISVPPDVADANRQMLAYLLRKFVSDLAGLMLPILGCLKNKRETMIRDRFFLGGVASLRGFAHKGVGPHAERRTEPESTKKPGMDALGGDLFATIRGAVGSCAVWVRTWIRLATPRPGCDCTCRVVRLCVERVCISCFGVIGLACDWLCMCIEHTRGPLGCALWARFFSSRTSARHVQYLSSSVRSQLPTCSIFQDSVRLQQPLTLMHCTQGRPQPAC